MFLGVPSDVFCEIIGHIRVNDGVSLKLYKLKLVMKSSIQ